MYTASPKWGCKNDWIPTCRVKEGDCEGRVVGTATCGVRVGGADGKNVGGGDGLGEDAIVGRCADDGGSAMGLVVGNGWDIVGAGVDGITVVGRIVSFKGV